MTGRWVAGGGWEEGGWRVQRRGADEGGEQRPTCSDLSVAHVLSRLTSILTQCPRLLHFSSARAHGPPPRPMPEHRTWQPASRGDSSNLHEKSAPDPSPVSLKAAARSGRRLSSRSSWMVDCAERPSDEPESSASNLGASAEKARDGEGEGRRGEAGDGEGEKAREGEGRRGQAREGEGRRGQARAGEGRRGQARAGEGRRGQRLKFGCVCTARRIKMRVVASARVAAW